MSDPRWWREAKAYAAHRRQTQERPTETIRVAAPGPRDGQDETVSAHFATARTSMPDHTVSDRFAAMGDRVIAESPAIARAAFDAWAGEDDVQVEAVTQ